MKPPRYIIILALAAILASCDTPPPVPVKVTYNDPKDGISASYSSKSGFDVTGTIPASATSGPACNGSTITITPPTAQAKAAGEQTP